MIESFGNKLTEHLFDGTNSKLVKKFPKDLHQRSIELLDLMASAETLLDIKSYPGTRLEKKKGQLKEYLSIRINEQWRILFKWRHNRAEDVQIVDYH